MDDTQRQMNNDHEEQEDASSDDGDWISVDANSEEEIGTLKMHPSLSTCTESGTPAWLDAAAQWLETAKQFVVESHEETVSVAGAAPPSEMVTTPTASAVQPAESPPLSDEVQMDKEVQMDQEPAVLALEVETALEPEVRAALEPEVLAGPEVQADSEVQVDASMMVPVLWRESPCWRVQILRLLFSLAVLWVVWPTAAKAGHAHVCETHRPEVPDGRFVAKEPSELWPRASKAIMVAKEAGRQESEHSAAKKHERWDVLAAAETDRRHRWAEKEAGISHRLAQSLRAQGVALAATEAALAVTEAALANRTAGLKAKGTALTAREEELSAREAALAAQEAEMAERQTALDATAQELRSWRTSWQAMLAAEEKEVLEEKAEVAERQAALDQGEQELRERDATLAAKEKELGGRQEALLRVSGTGAPAGGMHPGCASPAKQRKAQKQVELLQRSESLQDDLKRRLLNEVRYPAADHCQSPLPLCLE